MSQGREPTLSSDLPGGLTEAAGLPLSLPLYIPARVRQAVLLAGTYEGGAVPLVLARLDVSQANQEPSADDGTAPTINTYQQEFLKEQMRAIIQQRYTLSHFFIPYLEAIIEASDRKITELSPEDNATAGYVQLRDVVADNRDEEIADPDNQYSTRPHPEGRKRLLTAMGMSEEGHTSWLETSGDDLDNLDCVPSPARQVLEYLRGLTETNVLAAAVAFLDYETRIPNDYPYLLAGVTRGFGFSTEGAGEVTRETQFADLAEVWHLFDHIGHDGDHAQAAKEAIAAIVQTPEDVQLVAQTLINIREVWQEFWNKLAFDVEEIELMSELIPGLVVREPGKGLSDHHIQIILRGSVERLRQTYSTSLS